MSKFTLPNGVNLDGNLYNLIELNEITGEEQDILANPRPKTPFDYIEPVFSNVIVDITDSDMNSVSAKAVKRDVILHHLPIQDIQFILIKLREISYGNLFTMDIECEHCHKQNMAGLKLDELEVFPRKDKIDEDKLILPKDNIPFRYKHLSLANLLKMNFEDEDSQFMKSLKTSVTSFRVASLGDKKDISSKDIKKLKAMDIEFIEENAPDLAEPDMKVEHTCKHCGKDFEVDISSRVLVADFLLRSRT